MLPILEDENFAAQLQTFFVQLFEKLQSEERGHEANCASVVRDIVAIELSTDERKTSSL